MYSIHMILYMHFTYVHWIHIPWYVFPLYVPCIYVFQKNLVNFLKGKFDETPLKFTYFSDGAAACNKNRKNFFNLYCDKKDLSISAAWHFFATAHKKRVSDGVGGTMKRLGAQASFQQEYTDQIMMLWALYRWASSHISGIEFYYVTLHCKKENNFLW